MATKTEIIQTDILSDSWYTLKKVTYKQWHENDETTIQSREAYDRGNGAAILLYNQEKNTVILTRQFRLPTFINGNIDGMLTEVCAGQLDNDDPETCIRRETEEETGYRIGTVQKIMEAYMSPGSVTEIIHFFVAPYDKSMKVGDGGGLDEEQEQIDVLELPFEEAYSMIGSGSIKDGKTIMLLQYARIKQLMA